MAEGGEGRAANPPAPMPRYDKFGFLTADAAGDGERERRRRDDAASGSRRRKRRRSGSRSESRSRSRSASDSDGDTRNGSRSPARSKRERPPPPSRLTLRGLQEGSDWEKSFAVTASQVYAGMNPHPVPVPGPVAPPPAVPAPSYSAVVAPGTYPDNYGNQFHPGYANFSVIDPASVSNRTLTGQEMNVPTTGLNSSQWAQLGPPPVANPARDEKFKREAIASELRNQRATLAIQKEEYIRKANVLKRELESLKEQRTELRGDARRSPSPETQKFLKENGKLQDKLQSKLKTMNNVIEMLNGIIENNPGYSDILSINNKEKKRKSSHRTSSQSASSGDSSSDNEKRSSRRKTRKSSSGEKKFNYAYYDPELHWCRVCNEFPTTAKDYLTHLHTSQHHRAAAVHMEAPWHNNSNTNEGFPSFPGVPIKRTPIKGLQFFVPSTAWYCKLCDQWIGDLHCASAHLKSVVHSKNYTNFTELNPHWEMDWMSDRQKNFEKKPKTGEPNQNTSEKNSQYSPHTISFQPDGFHTKYKKNENNPEEENTIPLKLGTKKEKKKKDKKEKKKKKKRSTSVSSTSSDSSSDSKSEDIKKRKSESQNENWKPEEDPSFDDHLINQWMSVQDAPSEQDRKMLEEVKNRVKSKAEERVEQRVDGRVVSREREARELLSIKSERVRLEALSSSKNDMKEKEKEREYRSSHRDKDKDSDRRRSEKSHHRDKDRDYESSKYRYSSSSNKIYSHDSEFKPYPGKRENHDANESRFDKQVSSKSRKSGGNSHSNSNDSKKMPFIGKMPLYKNQGGKGSKQESEPNKQSDQECMEAAKKKRDEINAQLQKSMETFKEQFISTMAKRNEEMEAQLLPEPKLIVPMSLHSHAPIVDVTEMMIPKAPVISALPQTIHRIQPQSMTSVTVANPPSGDTKLPTSKNDCLHKDFQDALDIIFPSDDKPKPEVPLPPAVEAESEDVPATIATETEADPNLYSQMSAQGVATGYQSVPMMMPGVMTPMATPYMSHMMMGYDYTGTMYDPNIYDMSAVQPLAPDSSVSKCTTDMEDLAMLGIDAEDVGAGGF